VYGAFVFRNKQFKKRGLFWYYLVLNLTALKSFATFINPISTDMNLAWIAGGCVSWSCCEVQCLREPVGFI